MKVDFLIVGHGIAGISIYEHLTAAGKNCLVINEEKEFSSSKVAAGLYNPITGRKMKQTWKANELFPYLQGFYGQLEKDLKAKILIEKSIYRPFASIEDQNEWLSNQYNHENFVAKTYTSSQFNEIVNDPFGGILLKNSGFVDLKKLILEHRNHIQKKQAYKAGRFKYNQLKIEKDRFIYSDIEALNLIFCDGPLSSNPYFDWIPVAPVKGELLHIKLEQQLPDDIIFNKGVFILRHQEGNYYRVGSTYEWKDLSTTPTEKAKNQIINKLNELIKVPYQIVDQVAGIRPATKDRRPLIGTHPTIKNMFIFNGLGTKGVSLAPYFAQSLTNYILNRNDLHNEVNINRYYSLYSS
ncbi:FAD-dependent oxidoreductase [Marivirga atlantica]|jgi:glycine/D-amino acid oxidase-like deaminating enzyme|uniref:FAD-binding oxidoreductase n=1 Tax=Marivirga atlantica TaxID=1548457 RepID=A0A937ANT2_9BACT|nr:FAD-dependent oxidoreductase [Marivirga atlantica]MBL0766903.1 FAD-binding oxidoreductase [Marivirga atlantica]